MANTWLVSPAFVGTRESALHIGLEAIPATVNELFAWAKTFLSARTTEFFRMLCLRKAVAKKPA